MLNGPGGSELRTTGFGRPDAGDGDRMWNLAPLIPEAQRFTRGQLAIHQGSTRMNQRDSISGQPLHDESFAAKQADAELFLEGDVDAHAARGT